MQKYLKRAAVGVGMFGAASFGTAYYYFPEIRQDFHQLTMATQRVLRVSTAGIRMAYIYGIKSIDMHQKHTEASKVLHDAFKENGGIYIKVGQILASIDILAPDEYVAQLSQLYQSAKQSSFESVREQFEESTHKKLEDAFSKFNPVPLSAASIGQVHEAYLKDGQKVAVKVQHKWLKEQCQGDIRVIDTLIRIGEVIFPDFKYRWFGDELRKYVPSELNFALEAENSDKTRELFRNNTRIYVPKIYHEFSNDKILVMEYVNGVSIDKIDQIKKMGLDLKEVAKILSHCFSLQIFRYGHVHADPHPGNLFVSAEIDARGNKKPRLTLLDHGLYQDLTDEVKLQYSYLWKGILLRDEELIKKAATDLGVGDWYPLLAAMVSRKSFSDIMDVEQGDYNDRLKLKHTTAERDRLQTYAKRYAKEITMVLSDINKDVMLLFKTNDFITSITNRLGDPVKKYEILAKYCFEAVERQELKNKDDIWSRLRLWRQKTTTIVGLRIIAFYYNLVSWFKPQQELPDEVLI